MSNLVFRDRNDRQIIITPEDMHTAINLLTTSWCRGAWAIDAKGDTCRPTEPTACRWCAVGALANVIGTDDVENLYNYLDISITAADESQQGAIHELRSVLCKMESSDL
jgi:hypothetical protein